MKTWIALFIENLPLIMTALALILGIIHVSFSKTRPASDVFLGYLFFLGLGVSGLWGFVFHVFFGDLAAKFIGWPNSPFQFEVGIANLAMAVVGFFGLCASRSYRVAGTLFTMCFLWGAAVGHIIQMHIAGNFAPGNAGLIFYNDLILPLLLIFFLTQCCKSQCELQH